MKRRLSYAEEEKVHTKTVGLTDAKAVPVSHCALPMKREKKKEEQDR